MLNWELKCHGPTNDAMEHSYIDIRGLFCPILVVGTWIKIFSNIFHCKEAKQPWKAVPAVPGAPCMDYVQLRTETCAYLVSHTCAWYYAQFLPTSAYFIITSLCAVLRTIILRNIMPVALWHNFYTHFLSNRRNKIEFVGLRLSELFVGNLGEILQLATGMRMKKLNAIWFIHFYTVAYWPSCEHCSRRKRPLGKCRTTLIRVATPHFFDFRV